MNKVNNVKEWIKQAEYDFQTAAAMFKSGRYIHCVFMCHLAVEKMLKALYIQHFNKLAPKVHNLVYLVEVQQLELSEEPRTFIDSLNKVSIPTRYPGQLDQLLRVYPKQKTKETLKCLKAKSIKSSNS